MKVDRVVVAVSVVCAMGTFGGVRHGAVVAQQVKSQWDGLYTETQAKRGEALYTDSCSLCHGPNLTGTDYAPALAGPGFAGKWNEKSLGDLFEYMRVAMPLVSPGGFSRQQNADILAFILRRSNYPAGSAELPSQTELLGQYKFLAAKR